MKEDRIIDNGKVSVAISKSGWSTLNGISPFNVEFNQLFIDKKFKEAEILANKLDIKFINMNDIKIVWIPISIEFLIHEYCGFEYIIKKNEINFYKA